MQRISLDPDPPVHGAQVTICYDFDGLQLTSTDLEVTFTPAGNSKHTVTPSDPCVTIDVPANATRIIVEDLDGPSPDLTAPVV